MHTTISHLHWLSETALTYVGNEVQYLGPCQQCKLDTLIIGALRYIPHPSHLTVRQALTWIERIRPKRAILTHLHIDLDYAALKKELPSHVEPAYDGMTVDVAVP